jgi:hypothetical protein
MWCGCCGYHGIMYPLIRPSEKPLALGVLLVLIGLPGLLLLDAKQHPSLRFAAGCFFVVGWLVFHCSTFARRWDDNLLIRRVHGSPDGVLWLRIAAVVLWLGILPVAILWVYQYLHRS